MFSHSVSDRLDELKKSVTKADTILKAVLKSLKTFHKAGELFDKLEASWTASMKELEENSHITEPIPWIPLQNEPAREVPSSQAATSSVLNVERVVRENVPQVIHPGWSAAERDRANEVCSSCTPP